MNDRDLYARPIVRVAGGALLASTLLAMWALVVALNAGGPVTVPLTPFNGADSLATVASVASADVAKAVEKDPFAPDRTAPTGRYRLPGEHDESAVAATPPIRPIVIGTAVIGENRSFATCRLGDDAPVILHVGDHLGMYTVRAITRGVVRFTSTSGESLDIPAMKSGVP